MKPIRDLVNQKPWLGWLLFLLTLGGGALLGLFLTTIAERRTEARFAYGNLRAIPEHESRNEVWGESYPRQFETYYQTADTTFASKYGGSVTRDLLADYPELVTIWAGHPFSWDYKQSRGHYYAVEDVRNILRSGSPETDSGASGQPATCWTCKSTDVPRVMAEVGPREFYNKNWAHWGADIVNPIGCADCHDPSNMALRITRPALAEAFARMGKDITKSTHQEMRSLVCAQCHVEYYFKGPDKYLTFPWDKGFSMENMEAYYDSVKFSDWTHKLSRAPMLKAQHPDYEMYLTGIHAQRGVSCADCHMPYMSEGGLKFTNHHIQSPLNHIDKACQVCHRESAEELRRVVYDRQDKLAESRRELEKILVRAHIEAKTAWDAGATEAQMKPSLLHIRAAQWRWDYAAAGHGNSFHAPVETGRIIANGIARAQDARLGIARVLASLGKLDEVELPDLSTKTLAQAYIGLDMPQKEAKKKVFKDQIVPRWLHKAKAREATY